MKEWHTKFTFFQVVAETNCTKIEFKNGSINYTRLASLIIEYDYHKRIKWTLAWHGFLINVAKQSCGIRDWIRYFTGSNLTNHVSWYARKGSKETALSIRWAEHVYLIMYHVEQRVKCAIHVHVSNWIYRCNDVNHYMDIMYISILIYCLHDLKTEYYIYYIMP